MHVFYDPGQVSLDALLLAYFYVIDPTVKKRQISDIGAQYQTGVYYTDEERHKTVERITGIKHGTEYPFKNEYWNQFEKGIYVDIVTGEPLFSSRDKFASECGWPAFSRPIEEPSLTHLQDLSHGMRRIEVRSRAGDTHLGHAFTDDPESPNGIRYCINSASLRFVSYEKMEQEGYGYMMEIFE